jgi:ubiquitin carboxyl-terminal hydrolase 34
MNSMMQQFFMVPAFRYNMLCVDDGVKSEMVKYKGEEYDDNMLHQMQKLVSHLELSQRTDFNPVGFCFSFKEFDGTPTNTAEQKDA